MEMFIHEVEDDVFFADLSKQLSLLIMDDDEEDSVVAHSPSLSLQVFSQAIHLPIQTSNLYEQTCRRESKGTGVFIPRSSNLRRKNRQGRHNVNNSSNHMRQLENTRGLRQVHCNIDPSYDSFSNTRF